MAVAAPARASVTKVRCGPPCPTGTQTYSSLHALLLWCLLLPAPTHQFSRALLWCGCFLPVSLDISSPPGAPLLCSSVLDSPHWGPIVPGFSFCKSFLHQHQKLFERRGHLPPVVSPESPPVPCMLSNTCRVCLVQFLKIPESWSCLHSCSGSLLF